MTKSHGIKLNLVSYSLENFKKMTDIIYIPSTLTKQRWPGGRGLDSNQSRKGNDEMLNRKVLDSNSTICLKVTLCIYVMGLDIHRGDTGRISRKPSCFV